MKKLFITVLLCSLAVKVYGVFEEVPKSQLISTGDSATFRCRHGSADTIRWRVDHVLISANPSTDITPNTIREGGHVVHTLTIVGRPEYNGTIIECVAMFDDHSPDEQTVPAVLHISVVIDNLFGQFIEHPTSLNMTYGETAVFVCRHQSADLIKWEVIPRWLYDLFEPTSIGGKHLLSVDLLDGIDYNATTVQCMALFVDSPTQSTEPATLLVQDALDPVGDLWENKTTSTLSWTPPPSLDLTNVDPDIVYCVDVYNITCGMRDHIISDCNVTEPSYTRRVAGDGFIYEHVITPRSNVPEASNGTSQSLKDEYPALNCSETANVRNFRDPLAISVDPALNQSLPSSYTMFLESTDDLATHDPQMTVTAVTNNSTIYFNLSSIPTKRLFTCKIRAYGCTDNSSLLATFELSTHDVQNITMVTVDDGILIEGYYIDNSEAKGLLVIVYNTHDPNKYSPRYYSIQRHRIGPKRWKIRQNLTDIGTGKWSVSVFVMERNGLPFSRVAMPPRTIFIPNSSSDFQPQPFALIEYSVQPRSECALITCHFKQVSSATDCLVIVHQQLTQINLTSGLMNLEANWTRRFTRRDDMASGCIHGVDLGLHQIGVVNGREVQAAPEVNTPVAVVVISILAIILLIALTLLSITVLIVLRSRTRRTSARTRLASSQGPGDKTSTHHQPVTVSERLETMERSGNRNRYVTLWGATLEVSKTKQVDKDTYASNVFELMPAAECEDGGNSTSGTMEEVSTPLNEACQALDQGQWHDSSGTVSQELHSSDSESAGRDGVFPFGGEPIEVVGQHVKTATDLDTSMESIATLPENADLIPTAVKGFPELCEEPYLPQSEESSLVAHELQPETAQPLPHDLVGDEVVLPGRCCASCMEVTKTKDQVGEYGIDADAGELVTGVGKTDEDLM